jgi:endonuclease VIII
MPEGDTIHRAASALRTALGGKAMIRFDAPKLVGPVPQAGRTIEKVESHGKHLEIAWDNGMVLHTHMRMSGSWHVYRHGENWRRPYQQMCASIENDDWVAVCFNAPLVETYRLPDKRRHPGMGRLGPDLAQPDTNLDLVARLLLSYGDAEARLGEVLLDQRVMYGLGNVLRCEVLWATGISPFAPVGALSERDVVRVVNTAAAQARSSLREGRPSTANVKGGVAVYGRNGQGCVRCPGTVDRVRMGTHERVLYWCPSCQTHLDPRVLRNPDDTPAMDPHPAAKQFLADLPWNRF